ncbi:MAG: steroid 5-alpha reductase [Desulfuromonas sp.]|nr:MAG: steroid 5-alpha reductase [Desulfuromonas sp.]
MNVFLLSGLLLILYMGLMFLLAQKLADNSIVDVAYGPGFVLAGWAGYLFFGNGHPRQLLLLFLISLWGIRLALHIARRKRTESGEDSRYRQWRERWGENFVWRSFLQIFMLQGGVIYLVALPIFLVISAPGGALGWRDLIGTLIWLFGFSYEAIGDRQLLRFKENRRNRGRIMRCGLWRTTRHPNYFGEATLWWGIFLVALAVPLGWLALISPLMIGVLLLKVSGIPMLEDKYAGNPDFEEYKRKTNAFFPWFPKS